MYSIIKIREEINKIDKILYSDSEDLTVAETLDLKIKLLKLKIDYATYLIRKNA